MWKQEYRRREPNQYAGGAANIYSPLIVSIRPVGFNSGEAIKVRGRELYRQSIAESALWPFRH
jgi:hypothetical protein